MPDFKKFNLPERSRSFWRLREKESPGFRVTPHMGEYWSGTVLDVLALPIETDILLWALSRANVMPARLQLLLSIRVAQAFPQGSKQRRKCIIPDEAVANLEEYVYTTAPLSHIRNFQRPTILHNADTGKGLEVLLQHFRLSANRQTGRVGMEAFNRSALTVLRLALKANT